MRIPGNLSRVRLVASCCRAIADPSHVRQEEVDHQRGKFIGMTIVSRGIATAGKYEVPLMQPQ